MIEREHKTEEPKGQTGEQFRRESIIALGLGEIGSIITQFPFEVLSAMFPIKDSQNVNPERKGHG